MTEDLIPHIKGLIEEHVVGDVDREKTFQFAEARKHELYWRARQYVYPIYFQNNVVDWEPLGRSTTGRYDYVINQIRGDGRKFVAVLGQRAPNVKAVPNRLDDEAACRMARRVNDLLAELRSRWPIGRVQRQLALSLWKNGTTFAYTPWVADGRKYGWVEVPNLELQAAPIGEPRLRCPECGLLGPPEAAACQGCGRPLSSDDLIPPEEAELAMPVAEPTRYPKGDVELHLATIFKVTTPFYGDSIDSLPWLWFEEEKHQSVILSTYDDGLHPYAMKVLRRLMSENDGSSFGSGLSAQGRLSRDLTSSPSASTLAPRKNRWLWSVIWLSPCMYWMVRDDEVRARLAQSFPSGLRVTLVNGEIIDLAEERKEDVWAMCLPEPGEQIYPDPIARDYMAVQDLINDAHNILVETMERSNRVTFFDPTVISIEAIRQHQSVPGEFVPAVPGVGKRLQDSVWTSPAPEINSQIIGWVENLIGKAREIVGILPALFGGEGPSQTAYEASRKLNQALMQLSPVWNEMRDFWRDVYMNGVRQKALYDPEWSDIGFEGWHLEVEEAIPMSWGQIRDFFAMLIDLKSPDAWRMFGLDHPSNLSTIYTALGLHGWTVPNLKERDHILDTIRLLLEGVPIEGPEGPEPSIPPDPLEFTPQLVVDVVKEWAAGDGARVKSLNPQGYANVMAWARAYARIASGPPPGPPPPAAAPEPPQARTAAGAHGGEPRPENQDLEAPEPPTPPSVAGPVEKPPTGP